MSTTSRPGMGSPSPRATWTVRFGLGVVCAVWTIPVIGTLTNSFRTRDAQQSTGWWTAIASPLDVTQWTLDNYRVTLFTTSSDALPFSSMPLRARLSIAAIRASSAGEMPSFSRSESSP